MAKGKKKALTTSSKPEDTQHKVNSKKGTKENNPEMSKECTSKSQSTIKSLWSPSKPRSPLSDNSSLLLQEGNGPDKLPADTSQLKKDAHSEAICNINAPKEENLGKVCTIPQSSEPITEQLQEEDLISQTNPEPAHDIVTVLKTARRTGPKATVKKTENKSSQNRKVTDYYPIRRSSRKTKTELKSEEHKHLDELIKNGVQKGMKVKDIEGKGRGVFAVRGFKKGEFVVEYHGDLLSLADAKKREEVYAQDPGTGCYMYYFQYHGKTYCVDATRETGRLGRLINHSKNGNCQTKLHGIDGTPHLILVASRDIEAEEELLYDYGDRSKDSISAHPWLKY